MNATELYPALAAYRNGLNADIVLAKINGTWEGPIWTVPPCDPDAMERMGRQCTRCRAQAVQHTCHARLHRPSSSSTESVSSSAAVDVVILTEIPSRSQIVIGFDGVVLRVEMYLEDASLQALTASFLPTPRPR